MRAEQIKRRASELVRECPSWGDFDYEQYDDAIAILRAVAGGRFALHDPEKGAWWPTPYATDADALVIQGGE